MLKLDSKGQFVSTNGDQIKVLGVIASQKRGRWQYRDADSDALYASGMTPDAFAKRFWLRDDFVEE